MTPERDCAEGVNPNTFFSGLFRADTLQKPVFVQRRYDENSGTVLVSNSTRCAAAKNNATTYVGLRIMDVYDREVYMHPKIKLRRVAIATKRKW